jgi:cytochrome c6
MKRLALVVAVLASASIARADAAAGELFAKKCAVCHGKDGKGSAGGLKMGVKDLSAESKATEAAIATEISNGKGKMPAFKGKLTDAEIQSLAKFVKAGLK